MLALPSVIVDVGEIETKIVERLMAEDNDLGDELQHDLLVAYNDRPPTPSEQLRLNLSVWLYDYVCLLWCELYLKPSAPGAGDAAQDSAAARAGQLAARLIESASSRAG